MPAFLLDYVNPIKTESIIHATINNPTSFLFYLQNSFIFSLDSPEKAF